MITYYDHQFNENEWFVVILLFLGYSLVSYLPKIFTKKETIIYLLYGVFWGNLFDHTLSVGPFNFYNVNDNSTFQFMDLLSYFMYGPFSYMFLYLWVVFRIKVKYSFFYILGWSLLSLLVEHIGVVVGLFHYRAGYKPYFSLLIYIFVQTNLVLFYYLIKGKTNGLPKGD